MSPPPAAGFEHTLAAVDGIGLEDFPDPDVTFERRLGYVLDGLTANGAQR